MTAHRFYTGELAAILAIPGLIEEVKRVARETGAVAAEQRIRAVMGVAGRHAFRDVEQADFGLAGEAQTDLAGYATVSVYAFTAPRLTVYGAFLRTTRRKTFLCSTVEGGRKPKKVGEAALTRAASAFASFAGDQVWLTSLGVEIDDV